MATVTSQYLRERVTSSTPLIDIDKAKQAFASSTLCQHTFFKPGTEVNPHMLCAVSAMVVYAGMTPELWSTLATDSFTLWSYALPILEKQYNIPSSVAERIPRIFDAQPNEWRAVEVVLAEFESYNKTILHAQAIEEDARRFPQQGPVEMRTATSILAQEFKSKEFWVVPGLFSKEYVDKLFGEPGKIAMIPSGTKSLTEQDQIRDAMAAKERKLQKAAGLKAMWLSHTVNSL